MKPIIECVPNISEGRDHALIEKVASGLEKQGAKVLWIDCGKSTNRSVITWIVSPENFLGAAFFFYKECAELIDMRKHRGAHPRIGAVDVFPVVPMQGISMSDCVTLSKELGEKVGRELGLPIYLYEESASSTERQALPFHRRGQYEGLKARMASGFAPDYGPKTFQPKFGASVLGARKILVAFNVSLNTKDPKIAESIARQIRDSGFSFKENGESIVKRGAFKHCRAIGWYIDEYQSAQVSINFTDFTITPLHEVFDMVRELANQAKIEVLGSELIGLIPREVLRSAGEHCLQRQGLDLNPGLEQLLKAGVSFFGLDLLQSFDLESRVLESALSKAKLL